MDEIYDLIESVSEGFPTYFPIFVSYNIGSIDSKDDNLFFVANTYTQLHLYHHLRSDQTRYASIICVSPPTDEHYTSVQIFV